MYRKPLTPFQQALLTVSLEEFADIPDREDAIDLTPSPGFQARLKKCLRHGEGNVICWKRKTIKRVILAAAIAALLATTAMAIPSIREAILRFFTHREDTHYDFSFDAAQTKNIPDCINSVHLPSYITDGYTKEIDNIHKAVTFVGWHNSDNQRIIFEQYPAATDNKSGGINAEDSETQQICLNGYEVLRIENPEALCYVWTNSEYMFTLICDKPFSEKEMQKIFYSIRPDETVSIE